MLLCVGLLVIDFLSTSSIYWLLNFSNYMYAVKYNRILHTVLQRLEYYLNQCLYSPTTPHNSPHGHLDTVAPRISGYLFTSYIMWCVSGFRAYPQRIMSFIHANQQLNPLRHWSVTFDILYNLRLWLNSIYWLINLIAFVLSWSWFSGGNNFRSRELKHEQPFCRGTR